MAPGHAVGCVQWVAFVTNEYPSLVTNEIRLRAQDTPSLVSNASLAERSHGSSPSGEKTHARPTPRTACKDAISANRRGAAQALAGAGDGDFAPCSLKEETDMRVAASGE